MVWKSRVLLSVGFAVILLLSSSVSASANGGPITRKPSPGFLAIPEKNNSFEVLSELITFDLKRNNSPYSASVSVNYSIRNISDKSVTKPIAFIYVGETSDVNIRFNKNTIPFKVLTIPNLYFNPSTRDAKKSGVYLEKVNGAIVQEPGFQDILAAVQPVLQGKSEHPSGENRIKIAIFDISLGRQEDADLSVNYLQEAGIDRNGQLGYTYYYFLEPAKYWKSFSNLTIEIFTNDNYYLSKSSLPLTQIKAANSYYRGQYATLPVNNLMFKVSEKESFGSLLREFLWPLIIGPLGLIFILPLMIWLSIMLVKELWKRIGTPATGPHVFSYFLLLFSHYLKGEI